MPSSPPPRTRPAAPPRAAPEEAPGPEEVHVLFLGLDGLAAALAVRLLRCGVLGLNVNDAAPVTAADLVPGAYRPADLGQPRDAVLRRRLRELDPRCAPVSAPELFPGALLPGTVVVESAAPLPAAPAPVPAAAAGGSGRWPGAGIDPGHPLVSLHRAAGALVRWPTVPWAHRPCPDCVRTTLAGLEPARTAPGGDAVLAAWAAPAHAAAVAATLAVEVLAVALASLTPGSPPDTGAPGGPGIGADGGGPAHARVFAGPWPAPAAPLPLDRSRCLCGLAQG